ncbi:SdrD B-like domain-containing protein [uncultured Piscinibacter sp.]|uniref:SdrD B-like domain-containing protein n=1 Tax=uncultured Piscinibacter sp. TaxID=1131835 RepID=UPI002633D103|nr:SdrD B-like domain-containing protein [uncultured Piscinibacter sp.]
MAHAGTAFCRDYPVINGYYVIDGSNPAITPATLPSAISIDATDQFHCYIKNFPLSAKWPQGLTSTVNFANGTTGLVVFENVYYTGNMACSNTQVKIWFANGAFYAPGNNNACQDLFIPIEAVSKRTPGPTATIGVPFTYTVTVPVMYDPATGTTLQTPSPNTLSNATIYDDLTTIGASATYVSNTAFLVNGGTRTPIGPLALGASPATLSSLGIPASDNTKHIVFSSDANAALTSVAPGTQIEIQMTVVLDDMPANVAGTQFINTAKWWFGRVIDGVTYAPLPGQSGISAPMTIVEPGLTVDKSGSTATLNVGAPGTFRLNVQNAGAGDAWNVRVTDLIPSGMRGFNPTPTVTAALYAADGTTQLSALTAGTHYAVNYNAATGQLTLTLADGVKVGPSQRLVVDYQARLDFGTPPGLTFTNVAGATQWFNAPAGTAGRRAYSKTLTDGTPATLDFQDAFTVTSAFQGYYFLKSVANLTQGVLAPATTALPGDRLRYTLQIQNFTLPTLSNVSVTDNFGARSPNGFAPGSLTLVSSDLPAGTLNVAPNGGTNGAGLITISNLTLAQDQQYTVVVDVTLAPGLAAGTVVSNQGAMTGIDPASRTWNGLSDNPYVNGAALLEGATPPDATNINILSVGPLTKAATQATAAIGQPFTYRITVPATAQPVALNDVRVLDDISLAARGVSLSYVSARARLASNTRTWATLSNSGTATSLVLQDTVSGGLDVPAGDQLVVDVVLVLNDDMVNNAPGKQFSNTATYTYNSINGSDASRVNGLAGTSGAMTIVAPTLTVRKSGPATLRLGGTGTFTLNVQNTGSGTAWNTALTDRLPNITTAPTGGMCAAEPTNVTARVFQADGTTPVSADLVNGTDFTVGFAPAPTCVMTINLQGSAAAIAPTQRLILTYSTAVDPGTSSGVTLTNVAGATQWLSANPAVAGSAGRIHTTQNTLTNGTPGVLDFQDAFSLTTVSPTLDFRKSVVNVTTGQNPGSNARPGDLLRYTLTVRNISALALTDGRLTDELDRLNATAAFVPGSLTLVSAPAGTTATVSANGGAKGTGLLQVSGVNIAAQGLPGDTITIVFEARLASVITSATVVLNQARLTSATSQPAVSDDPNVSGAEDPTRTLIASNPVLQVRKVSQDVTGDPAVLRQGDRLRYTITVKNIGTENAVNVTLRDLVPANTSYVAGSTTLNGVTVADAGNSSPLQAGLQIHTPEDPTPGALRADTASTTSNVATITFDVTINANTLDGTLISNQGFVDGSGAGSGAFPEKPSDDPRTPAVDDPTRDIVGPYPLLVARKTVAIVVDVNGNGVLDPLDVIRYTITIDNLSGLPASGVVLTDEVPANTTYVADTVTLNGSAIARPDGGVSPLIAGIPVNSPAAASGSVAPRSTAVITFDTRVNAGVATGTVISNQGSVASTQLPSQLTDADGDSSNGYQPTTIIVGSAQQLLIAKAVQVVGGGPALPSSQLEYFVVVTNTGLVAATNVVITDDLGALPLASQVTYVAGSATLNGSTGGVSLVGAQLRADYAATYGTLAPGASAQLRFRVQIAPGLLPGKLITNTAQVAWNTPTLTASASATIAVGAIAGVASLNGSVWHDASLDKVADPGEAPLQGWTVEVLRNNVLLGTVTTDANGQYAISGLSPSVTAADQFALRFSAPGSGMTTAKLGRADSAFVNGMQAISGIFAPAGSNLQNLNLPLQPNGATYDSLVRTPVMGATLHMVRAGSTMPLPSGCFDDPVQQGQVTLAGGDYKFDLNFSDPSCPSVGQYLIQVTPPATYMPGVSKVIPPMSDANTVSFSVPNCPGSASDAVLNASSYCEAQASERPPAIAVPAGSAGTNYYLNLTLNNSATPGTSQIYNNHIAIDPRLGNAVTITKVAALQNVPRGQLVPYTITVTNTLAAPLTRLSVIDTFPAGFKYVPGTGRVDGQAIEPTVAGNRLTWADLVLTTNTKRTIQLVLIVGSGVSEGLYVNRAQVFSAQLDTAASPEASATVRVVPDPTLDCSDVIGKVFDDVNMNGYQDEGEPGLPGVRLVTANGLIVTTDPHGRFHVTCAVVPDPDRGSNFILKVDDRSLPTGYRVTTENPLVQRATRGKMIKFNFGAAIHRVVKLDLADGVFEPGKTEMRIQWKQRMKLLHGELKKGTSVLRLAYMAENESESLVKLRLAAIKSEIEAAWKREGARYDLTVETEVFWRTGAPGQRAGD